MGGRVAMLLWVSPDPHRIFMMAWHTRCRWPSCQGRFSRRPARSRSPR